MRRRRPPQEVVPASEVPDDERQKMAQWMRDQIAEIEREAEARVNLARFGHVHPMPVYANLVKHYAAMQLDPPTIAKMLMIPLSTLMLHYEEDIALGAAHINLKIAENMARIATSTTDANASRVGMQWLGVTNPRFKQKHKIEIDDDRETRVIDSSKLSPEQRQQLRDMIEAATAEGVDESAQEPSNTERQPGAGLGLIIGS